MSENKSDHVLNYSKTLVWRGLLNMTQRDAVREADGCAITSNWSINMLEFWKYNHYKYLILGHRFLARK